MSKRKVKAKFLWEHFEKNHENKENLFSMCLVVVGGAPCHKKIKNPHYSTTGIRNHLASQHTKTYSELLKKEAEEKNLFEINQRNLSETIQNLQGKETPKRSQNDDSTDDQQGPSKRLFGVAQTSKSSQMQSPSVFRQVIKYNMTDKRQLRFDLEVMKFLASSNLPFNLVETEGFQNLIKFLDPRLNVKSSRTFARSKLPLLYKNVKTAVDKHLEEELPSCAGVAFTTDLWSSRAFDPYLGLTIHFINKKWELSKFLVHCGLAEGRHTAAMVASHLDKIITDLKIDEKTNRVCTSDNAANMVAAIPKLTEQIDQGVGCADHLLHLIVLSSIKAVPEIFEALDSFKKLASRTHKSSLDQQRIRKECQKVSNDDSNPFPVTYCKIITPVDTRWNSILMMMRSILSLRPALEKIKSDQSTNSDKTPATDKKLQQAIPTQEEFDLIESIVKPLSKVESMSESLSSDQSVTITQVLPKIHNVYLSLSSMVAKEPSEDTKKFAKVMLNQFEERFPRCGTENFLYGVGNLLHPFFKGIICKEYQTYQPILAKFFSENEKPEKEPDNLDVAFLESGLDSDDEAATSELLFKKWGKKNQSSKGDKTTHAYESAITPLQLEWNRYQNLPDEHTSKLDVLQWWSSKSKDFPLLARAAKKYLCIQASSASSERVFSATGSIVSHKRTKLDPMNVNMLVYCKDNLPKVKIFKWACQEEYEDGREEEVVSKEQD